MILTSLQDFLIAGLPHSLPLPPPPSAPLLLFLLSPSSPCPPFDLLGRLTGRAKRDKLLSESRPPDNRSRGKHERIRLPQLSISIRNIPAYNR